MWKKARFITQLKWTTLNTVKSWSPEPPSKERISVVHTRPFRPCTAHYNTVDSKKPKMVLLKKRTRLWSRWSNFVWLLTFCSRFWTPTANAMSKGPQIPTCQRCLFCAQATRSGQIRGQKFGLKLKTVGWSSQGTRSELWGLLEVTGREVANSVESLTFSTTSEQDYKLEGKKKKTCCLWPNHLNSPPPTRSLRAPALYKEPGLHHGQKTQRGFLPRAVLAILCHDIQHRPHNKSKWWA